MFQTNASASKSNAIFVKVENESSGVDIMKYNCPSVASTSVASTSSLSNDTTSRLMSELADIRQKHSDNIYELEKTKELVVTLNNEKKQLVQMIDNNNQLVSSLSAENKAFELRVAEVERKMNELNHENNILKDQNKHLELSIESLHAEKLAAIDNTKSKDVENERLRKELKAAQARLKQNMSGTEQNKRYFSQPPTQEIANSYEVKQLLAHRKRKAQLEFKVQWKDTWIKESDLNCPKIKSTYWQKHK